LARRQNGAADFDFQPASVAVVLIAEVQRDGKQAIGHRHACHGDVGANLIASRGSVEESERQVARSVDRRPALAQRPLIDERRSQRLGWNGGC
jgi:hypothetical protein